MKLTYIILSADHLPLPEHENVDDKMDFANLDKLLNSTAGRAQDAEGLSLQSFATSITFSAGLYVMGFIIFIILKDRSAHI